MRNLSLIGTTSAVLLSLDHLPRKGDVERLPDESKTAIVTKQSDWNSPGSLGLPPTGEMAPVIDDKGVSKSREAAEQGSLEPPAPPAFELAAADDHPDPPKDSDYVSDAFDAFNAFHNLARGEGEAAEEAQTDFIEDAFGKALEAGLLERRAAPVFELAAAGDGPDPAKDNDYVSDAFNAVLHTFADEEGETAEEAQTDFIETAFEEALEAGLLDVQEETPLWDAVAGFFGCGARRKGCEAFLAPPVEVAFEDGNGMSDGRSRE